MSWTPPRYRIDAVAQALEAELAAIDPLATHSTDMLERLAAAAIKADRQAILLHPIGRAHT